MMKSLFGAALAAVVTTSSLHAHEPRKGPNGGELVDAGSYHIEVIGKGTVVEVLVSDATDRPLRLKASRRLRSL